MKFDQYKCIVMEQTGWPGSIGDSYAETFRWANLKRKLGEYDFIQQINPSIFFTDKGELRHPTAPFKDQPDLNGNPIKDSWREDDFTSDQAVPSVPVLQESYPQLHARLKSDIKKNWWRTGNGDLVSPGLFALLIGCRPLMSALTVGQSLIFRFPWRWNDEKKGFERSSGSSADYLNFIHVALEGYWWCRKVVSKDLLKQKIRDYYKDEPNSQWIIDLYDRVIDKYF